jgi:hypothetical protein
VRPVAFEMSGVRPSRRWAVTVYARSRSGSLPMSASRSEASSMTAPMGMLDTSNFIRMVFATWWSGHV